MHITISFAVLLIGFMCNAISFAASFDCDKAITLTEKAICTDSQLSALDDQMVQSYKNALAHTSDRNAITAAQRSWLSQKRNTCRGDITWLQQAYTARLTGLDALSASFGAQQTSATQVSTLDKDQKISLGAEPRSKPDLSDLASISATQACVVSGGGLRKHPALRTAMLRDLGQRPFKRIASGWGSQGPCSDVNRFGDILHVFSCQAHNCATNSVNLFIDLASDRIQACWSDEGKAYWIAPGAPPRPLDVDDDCTEINLIGEAGMLAKYGTTAAMAGRVTFSERLGAQVFARGGPAWCGEQVQFDVVVSNQAYYKNQTFFSGPDFATLIQNVGTKILSQTCPAARAVIIRGMGGSLYVNWTGSASATLGWKPVKAPAVSHAPARSAR